MNDRGGTREWENDKKEKVEALLRKKWVFYPSGKSQVSASCGCGNICLPVKCGSVNKTRGKTHVKPTRSVR